MDDSRRRAWQKNGVRRLIDAGGHQWAGIRHALATDSAIRQVTAACLVLVLIALLVPVSRIEKLLLIVTPMLVVMAEYLNSAIEATVDRISQERHPLSKQAKDYGSVAVAISVMIFLLTWAIVLGPPALVWLGWSSA